MRAGWTLADGGWGRRAVDFATLSEPGNCREYVAVQHRLGVGDGDRPVDVACGSGLALELAGVCGAAATVANQAAMVSLGRLGEWARYMLARSGFVDVERFEVPFVWEFADPENFARALASTGPGLR